jgi:ribosomal protein L16 Arg81 hydroxylase
MPPSSAERHLADQPLVMPGGAPDIEGTPSETVRTIETNGCWMVLWNIEDDPEYARLMNDFLDEAERMIPLRRGDMRNRQAFVFLSAPNATTPVHIDPEHNFLLQIRGVKEMNVGRWRDAAHEAAELERYYGGGHRNLDALPDEVATFRMDPGDATYVPSFAPHFVKNMDNVSISLSITFRTRASERYENIHRFNAKLRKQGKRHRPVGASRLLDSGKALVVHTRDRARGKAVGRREKG